MDLLLAAFLISIGINLVMFVPAYIYKTDKLTDISYSITFAVVACFSFLFSEKSSAHYIILLCVLAWAVRLGGFLLMRIWKIKRDRRFDGMRESFSRFLKFWLAQGVSVFIILLACILFWNIEKVSLELLSYIGLAVFAVGLLLEATADLQKYRFNNNPKNAGRWIQEGVWGISRHPNYLGEMLVWSGLYIAVFGSLTVSGKIIGLISPIYIISLLLFVSGIPILEKNADARWGEDKNYQLYKETTPLLLPRIFKK